MANPYLASGPRHVKQDVRFKESGALYPAMLYAFKGVEITVEYGRKYAIGSKHIVSDIAYYDAVGPNGYGGQAIIYFVTTNGDRIASHNVTWDINHVAIMAEYERDQRLATML